MEHSISKTAIVLVDCGTHAGNQVPEGDLRNIPMTSLQPPIQHMRRSCHEGKTG